MQFEATIIAGKSLEPLRGPIVFEEGRIQAVGRHSINFTDILLSAFVDAHTRIGDSVAKEP